MKLRFAKLVARIVAAIGLYSLAALLVQYTIARTFHAHAPLWLLVACLIVIPSITRGR